jgi:C4-dicarboxylate-specific signal transduction histidine kinase
VTVPEYQNLSDSQLKHRLNVLQEKLATWSDKSKSDLQHLVHDLQVHQVELEMQNRELRETQQQLEESRDNYIQLYDFAPIGYMTLDKLGRIVDINLTGAKLLGKPRSGLTGIPLVSKLEHGQSRAFLNYLQRVFRSQDNEVTEIRVSGKKGWSDLRLESITMTAADGISATCHTAMIDVTELKCMEQIKQQREEELAHIARINLLGEIATAVAHELSEPLTAMGCFAQAGIHLLGKADIDRQQLLEAFRQIQQQVQRAGNVTANIRKFSGRGEQQLTHANINTIIGQAVKLVSAHALASDVDIKLELAESLPPVLCDARQLEQVMVNLLLRALESFEIAESSSRVVRVRAKNEKNQVHVRVIDTGKSIDSSMADHLFDPGFSTRSAHFGMGLSVCRTIVELHGGRIWAKANPRQDTTIHFVIPQQPIGDAAG